jgi:hypothetical protein
MFLFHYVQRSFVWWEELRMSFMLLTHVFQGSALAPSLVIEPRRKHTRRFHHLKQDENMEHDAS